MTRHFSLGILVSAFFAACEPAPLPPVAADETNEAIGLVRKFGEKEWRPSYDSFEKWRGEYGSKLRDKPDALLEAIFDARKLVVQSQAAGSATAPIKLDWLDSWALTLLLDLGLVEGAGQVADAAGAPNRSHDPSGLLALKLALVATSQGNVPIAYRWLAHAASDANATPAVLGDVAALRGDLALQRGMSQAALEAFADQLRLAGTNPSRQFLAKINLARVEMSEGAGELALSMLDRLQEPEGLPLTYRIAFARTRALCLGAIAERPTGEAHLDGATDAFEQLLDLAPPPSDRALAKRGLARVAAKQGRRDAALQHLQGLSAAPASTESLRIFATRMLLDGNDPSKTEELLTRGTGLLDQFLHQRTLAPARRGGDGFLAYQSRRSLVESIITLTLRAGDPIRCWDPILKIQAHSSRARLASTTHQARPLAATPTALQEGPLTADGGLLCILLAHDRGYILGLDRDGAFVEELPGWFGWIGDIRKAKRALFANPEFLAAGDGYAKPVLELLDQLGQTLLPKTVRARIKPWRTIAVCDYGCLGRIPMEAIRWDQDHLLGERFAVSHTNSFAVDAAARAPQRRDVMFSLHAREVTARQLRQLASVYDKPRVANRAHGEQPQGGAGDIVADLARGAAITHVIAHGANTQSGEFRRKASLGPVDLTFEAMCTHEWTGMLILSVCAISKGPEMVGDGSFQASLGGAALVAGAHTAIQSSAYLSIPQHMELMGATHQRLRLGDSTAEALRSARATGAESAGPFARLQNASVQAFGAGHLAPLPAVGGR